MLFIVDDRVDVWKETPDNVIRILPCALPLVVHRRQS